MLILIAERAHIGATEDESVVGEEVLPVGELLIIESQLITARVVVDNHRAIRVALGRHATLTSCDHAAEAHLMARELLQRGELRHTDIGKHLHLILEVI